jgi:hypothetical protein
LQRLLGEHGEIQLSALGMAVSTMVSIAEILKKDGLAVETREPPQQQGTWQHKYLRMSSSSMQQCLYVVVLHPSRNRTWQQQSDMLA